MHDKARRVDWIWQTVGFRGVVSHKPSYLSDDDVDRKTIFDKFASYLKMGQLTLTKCILASNGRIGIDHILFSKPY